MTLKEIQKIIKDFENSELTELELEYKEVKLKFCVKNIPRFHGGYFFKVRLHYAAIYRFG